MTSEAVPQLVHHECHCKKTLFIFHKPKYLNTCNFNKHHKFRELVLEDEKRANFGPKFHDKIHKRPFPHDLFIVCNHSHFEIKALQIQSIAIEENFHQDPILTHFVSTL
jgi:hypothetical protein